MTPGECGLLAVSGAVVVAVALWLTYPLYSKTRWFREG